MLPVRLESVWGRSCDHGLQELQQCWGWFDLNEICQRSYEPRPKPLRSGNGAEVTSYGTHVPYGLVSFDIGRRF